MKAFEPIYSVKQAFINSNHIFIHSKIKIFKNPSKMFICSTLRVSIDDK